MSPAIFDFEGASVRVSREGETIWFVASDVAAVLEIQNPRQNLAAFPENEKGVCSIYTLGGAQNVAAINEAGLYRLIFQSRKPQAEKFKTWVFNEVLPAIRRTGQFSVVPQPEPSPFQIPATLSEALRLAADTMDQLDTAKAELADAAPKLEVYQRVMDGDGLFTFRQVAGMLAEKSMGGNNLVKFLLQEKVLYRDNKGHLLAFRNFIESGYFKAVESPYELKATGESRVGCQIKVTPKGVEFITRRMERSAA